MKRLLVVALLLSGCSMGQKVVYEKYDPTTGLLTCKTTVVAGEDKESVVKAKRTVTVGPDCSAKVDFGSTEETAGSQTAKAIDAVMGNLMPLLKTGVK